MRSSPPPASTVSIPVSVVMISSPPKPLMTSLLTVPVSTSSPEVPSIGGSTITSLVEKLPVSEIAKLNSPLAMVKVWSVRPSPSSSNCNKV